MTIVELTPQIYPHLEGLYKMKTKNLFGKVLILTLLLGLVSLGSGIVVPQISAAAAVQPGYELKVKNLTAAGSYGDNVTLADGETARFRLQITNHTASNLIGQLRIRSDFPLNINPTSVSASIKADSFNTQNDSVATSLPSGKYFSYVPGTTVYIMDDRPQYQTETTVSDIGGHSALTFTEGLTLYSWPGGDHSWLWVYFDLKVASDEPEVREPDVEFYKYVANTSCGETLDSHLTSTTASPGETVRVKLWAHNKEIDTIAHNAKIIDVLPSGTFTSQSRAGTFRSDETGDVTSAATFNLSEASALNYIAGSARIYHYGDAVGTQLNDTEVSALFGGGYNLGELIGCWAYQRWIEYELSVPTPTPTPTPTPGEPEISINKKIVWQGNEYDSIDKEVHIFDPDEKVYYKIYVTNDGDADATGVKVEDFLPTYIRTLGGNEIQEFDIGTIEAGKTWIGEYTAVVAEDLPQNDRTQENRAEVTSDNAGSDEDTAFIWINGPEILAAAPEAAAEELPATGPAVPVALGLSSLLSVGFYLHRKLA